MSKLGEDILKLRQEGKSYEEICKILHCSKGTVGYYIRPGAKERFKYNCKKYRNINPLSSKIDSFISKGKIDFEEVVSNTNFLKKLNNKIKSFSKQKGDIVKQKQEFNLKDLLQKIGDNPKCYLTGRNISLDITKSYELDHIKPISKGGNNSIDNCGLSCRDANRSKADLTIDEYLQLCEDVLLNFGYKVEKP